MQICKDECIKRLQLAPTAQKIYIILKWKENISNYFEKCVPERIQFLALNFKIQYCFKGKKNKA